MPTINRHLEAFTLVKFLLCSVVPIGYNCKLCCSGNENNTGMVVTPSISLNKVKVLLHFRCHEIYFMISRGNVQVAKMILELESSCWL